MKFLIISLLLLQAFLPPQVDAGPAASSICYAGCAAVVVACYAAAGATFGTVTAGVGTPAAIIGCNSAFGTCQAACMAAFFLPTP
jgi:hypothetical protein